MEGRSGISPEMRGVASEVFGTLLTITTILSGIYVSISFGWFGQAMIEPHPGEPMRPEMLGIAITGITLGLIFIVPLVLILLAWALAKFRNSMAWGTAAWAGLLYCLTQDFVGIVALFGFSLIASGAIIGPALLAAGASVALLPAIVGIGLGYRVGRRYSHSPDGGAGRTRQGVLPAVVMVASILIIQSALAASLLL